MGTATFRAMLTNGQYKKGNFTDKDGSVYEGIHVFTTLNRRNQRIIPLVSTENEVELSSMNPNSNIAQPSDVIAKINGNVFVSNSCPVGFNYEGAGGNFYAGKWVYQAAPDLGSDNKSAYKNPKFSPSFCVKSNGDAIAIYHCSIKIVSRGKGKSAVAAAAYRSGEKITNEWDGETHDFTRKRGVVHTEILLPPHAPSSFSDRSTLWNSVELYEKAGNAQLAREIDAALPIELSREEQIRLVREYCSSQFVSRGMCVDFAIHDTDSGNPHCHIMLTMRPLDERGAWAAKSKKEYDLDENGERIRLPSGRYKTHKVDLTGWNDKGNALLWRKAWADISNAYLERAGHPERIDHRSNAERGIDELPTVHMGVAACQMEKKGIATEKGELNRNIQKANRLIREIRAQIGKLKEWIADLFKARETAPEQPQQSPGLANLLMKYLSVQREKSRKYSQRWQQQHTADELKTIAAAVNYLSEHGISNLDELDASLSSVSDKAYSIREGMKTAEQRMKELQKLMEYGRNYQTYKPIQDEYRQIRWKGKQEKFAEARRAELTLWDAANRYLHAHLPEGVKTLPISAWEKEYTALKAQWEAEYDTLKETRAEVAELQKIRKCVDIALRADQPEQTQSRTKRHDIDR